MNSSGAYNVRIHWDIWVRPDTIEQDAQKDDFSYFIYLFVP